ncbi:MAG: tetratricopeptide repeat protein [Myxococcales bacterium]
MNGARWLLAALPLACGGASKERRPTVLHEMPAPEIARCIPGTPPPRGSLELDQLVTDQGDVPAAWVRTQQAQDGGQLFRCATRLATDAKYAAQKTDSVRTSRIACDGTSCQRADLAESRSVLDEKLAQATLHLAGWATAAERGWAQLLVRDYPAALKQLGQALKERPGDARALRGLATALAESGGDLARARDAAQKAVQLKPESAAGHETLARVCLLQKDDRCAVAELDAARKAPDAETRAADLRQLDEPVKAAAERIAAAEKDDQDRRAADAEAALQKIDPAGCRKLEPNSDAQLLCLVKRCFATSAQQYAKQLRTKDGHGYAAGEWKVASRKGDAAEVTVPIRPATPPKKRRSRKSGEQVEGHDATWRATMGENITLVPQNNDAANVARSAEVCGK